jgi:2-polyprenyl-3-methyl-5-hydroxy-6-metoxy-1,4-benzoquinol methylase
MPTGPVVRIYDARHGAISRLVRDRLGAQEVACAQLTPQPRSGSDFGSHRDNHKRRYSEIQTVIIDNCPVAPPSFAEAFSQLQAAIGPSIGSAQTILEAGGGSLSHIDIPASAEITVIDISPEQLENHKTAHYKILGDLHAVDFGTSAFDAAVMWNVIEHLENPVLVLDKLRTALRPGGIIVVAAPHPASLQAIVTRWTPHWFHVFVLKHVFRSKTAGLPGFPPFRTVHHADIAPHSLKAWAHQYGLEILIYTEYESTRRAALRKNSPVIALLWDIAISVGNTISRSPLDASDYFFVVKQPA